MDNQMKPAMTTTCPFCGAANDDLISRRFQSFDCGTMVFTNGTDLPDQSNLCKSAAEVTRLTKERDEARAEVARLKAGGCARNQRTTQFCAEAVALQERVKRLEEAGGALNGDVKALRAILADMGAKGTMGNASMEGWKKAKEAKP
jgi:hypothetical protein